MPIGTEVGDSVDEVVLTHVREVGQSGSIMGTVIRQGIGHRVGESVGSIAPRQRIRINRIFLTGFVVVEIQSFEHIETLFDLIIGDECFAFDLRLRSILLRTVVDDRITAYIEHIIARYGSIGVCRCTRL